MNGLPAEERIAQLRARAQAERLATQLAILEAREQMAPLRSAAGVIGVAVRALSPGGSGGAIGRLGRFGIDHPWLASTVAGLVWRLLRRRPLALLLAAAAGAAAWWLLRPPGQGGTRGERPAKA
jgi:hypothetical protein